MKSALDTYDAERLLSANVEDLVRYFVETASVAPLRLLEDDITADTSETKLDVSHRFEYGAFDGEQVIVPGTVASLHIPFEGDANLFRCTGSRRSFNPPYGRVVDNELVISFTGTEGDMGRAKQELDKELAKVREHVSWLEADIRAFNERLPEVARQAVTARRERLLEQRNLASSLGYAVRPRPGAPRSYSVPARRKVVEPRRGPGRSERFVPEPALDDATYESILTVLSNMVQVMEQSPDAFAGMGEEDLRSHFLVQLNGQFEVGVTGETFRGSGSTDILLQQDGRSVFLAECKFWNGPKSLAGALDQLLDYAIWRDARASVLLFNRNKDFSAVLQKIPGVIEAHPQVASEVAQIRETGFRFSLRHRDDPDRLILVTLLAFDVPTDRSRSDRLVPRSNRE